MPPSDDQQQDTENDEGSAMPHIRTYRGDVAGTVREKNLSAASIAIAEHEKRARQPNESTGRQERRFPVRAVILITAGILLIAGGLGALAYVILIKTSKTEDTVLEEVMSVPMLIFRDNVTRVDLTRSGRQNTLGIMRDEASRVSLPLNSVAQFFFTEDRGALAPDHRLVGAERFLEILETKAPGALVRSLEENFMFGVHVFDGNQPFLIFKTRSFESAFGNMIAWENDMSFDLAPLFASKESAPIIDRGFKDIVIRNKDARVVYDSEGKIVFIYSFLDRETLVVVSNDHTFKEIVDRMTRLHAQ